MAKPRMEGRTLFLACAGAAYFLMAFSLQAAPTGQFSTDQDSLQHEVRVTLKLVQVYVADDKGNPASGLEISDFVLYDNGTVQNITAFEKHFLCVQAPEAERIEPPSAAAMDPDTNRKFIFLLDYQHNDLEGIAKSRTAILKLLDGQILPPDEVALFSYSHLKGVVVHEYLTSDHQRLREGLKKVLDIPCINERWMSFSGMGQGAAAWSRSGSGSLRLLPPPIPKRLASRFQELALALRHIPGRKNIILFSRGIGGDVRHIDFLDMARELATANCAVFSVNTITGMGKDGVQPVDSLENLSSLTGGRYFHDVNYESKIAEDIQDATSHYYVLGYSIASNWDGKFHDIKVEVKKPGLKVHAQRGYFNPLPFTKLSAVEKHFHLIDLALGEKDRFGRRLNFPMVALLFSGTKGPNTLLISEVSTQTMLKEIGDNSELISLIFDQGTRIVESHKIKVNWRTLDGDRIFQYSVASLAAGRYDGRMIVRNLETGKAAVGACSVDISELSASGLNLYPPLLLAAGPKGHYLNVSGRDKGKGSPLADVFPFQAGQYSPLVGHLKNGALSFQGLLRIACEETGEPDLNIFAWLVPEDEEGKIAVGTSVLGLSKQRGANILFLEFQIPELGPGDYRLHIIARDAVTGLSGETSCGLSIDEPG